jgi:hypothetical protein
MGEILQRRRSIRLGFGENPSAKFPFGTGSSALGLRQRKELLQVS